MKLPFAGDRRSEIVRAALWTVAHNHEATYSEGSDRLYSLERPFTTPFISDCSAGVTDMYRWGLASDPNGLDYGGDPYTGTLIAHGRLIPARKVRSADVGILGPGTGWHAVLALSGGSDPKCWSMGEQGDPKVYPFSVVAQAVAYVNKVQSCEVRWFRYNTALAGT